MRRTPRLQSETTDGAGALAEAIGTGIVSDIRAADTKAMATFAVASGFATFTLEQQATLPDWTHIDAVLAAWPLITTLILLLLAMSAAAIAVIPRTKSTGKALVFWGTIAKQGSPEAYRKAILAKSPSQLEAQSLEHIYHISKVARRKFGYVRLAMICAALGTFASLYTQTLS